jgi:hypothetical protein
MFPNLLPIKRAIINPKNGKSGINQIICVNSSLSLFHLKH